MVSPALKQSKNMITDHDTGISGKVFLRLGPGNKIKVMIKLRMIINGPGKTAMNVYFIVL